MKNFLAAAAARNEKLNAATIVDIESNALELKNESEIVNLTSTSSSIAPISTDTIDQACTNCVPQQQQQCVGAGEIKEDVSSSSSVSDDDAVPAITLNMNKKTGGITHKGMMDIALLTANANQLRFLITYNSEAKTFYISAGLIVLSLIIQVAVGIGLIFKRQMKKKGNRHKADKTGNLIVSGIFCLAVINILAASFTTTTTVAVAAT